MHPDTNKNSYISTDSAIKSWVIYSLIILSIIALARYALVRIESQSRHDIGITLKAALKVSHEALRLWVVDRKADITTWARSAELRSSVKQLLSAPSLRSSLLSNPASMDLDNLLRPPLEEHGYLGYFITDTAYTVIAAQEKIEVGGTLLLMQQQPNFLPAVLQGKTLLSKLVLPEAFSDRPNMFIATPIYEGRKIIALLVFSIDPSKDFTRVMQVGRVGDTGESYAFDKEGKMLSESLFDEQLVNLALIPPGGRGILSLEIRDPGGNLVEGFHSKVPRSQQPLTHMAQEAIAGKSGLDLDGYRDYRGVPVVGTWVWDDELGFGLVSEIDKYEAYKSLNASRTLVLITIAIIVLLFLGTMVFQAMGRERLRQSEKRLRALFDTQAVGIVVIDEFGSIEEFNPACEALFKYSRQEVLGRNVKTLMPEPYYSEHDAYLKRYLTTRKKHVIGIGIEIVGKRKDGSTFPIELFVGEADLGNQHVFISFIKDITERKQSQESAQLASLVYQTCREAVMVTDADGVILATNPAFTDQTGFEQNEVVGKNARVLKSDRHDVGFFRAMWQSLTTTGQWQGEIYDRRKNGEIYPKWLTINSTFNADGSACRRVALFHDITERKKTEELVWQHANFDSLTGLPNRRMFHDRLDQEVKKAHRGGTLLALMFLDLDRFKEINDSMGHAMGDLLLKEVTKRLKHCVRETDTVSRLGGDEFTIILGNLEETGSVNRAAQSILESLSTPIQLGDHVVHISTSIGITLYPTDATEIETLIKNADQSMYVSKDMGRNRFTYFTLAMQEAAQTRMRLITDLRAAIPGNQFRVVYQPIVDLATRKTHKAEALIRWQHPARGPVSPAEFIPIAEETKMIIDIGNWVFRQAATQVMKWRSSHPTFQISVNMSPIQFLSDDLKYKGWFDQLMDFSLPEQSIIVEITEGLLLDANEFINNKLLRFRDVGMQVSLDDFGTGYSSLSYLKKFDIDYLKIDQSFVRNLSPDSDDLALCEAIIVMAHKLGMKVIAEGVETEMQRDILATANCDYGQGYLFAKPLSPQEFESFMCEDLS